MEPRISVITVGVDDLERAARFYQAMGLRRNEKITEGVAFFQMGGVILALWPRRELARDIGIEAANPPAGGAAPMEALSTNIALGYNTHREEEVAEILDRAEKAGGRIVKAAQRAFWGGIQGYFADTEGNLWEVAHNPGFSIDAEGRISLPE